MLAAALAVLVFALLLLAVACWLLGAGLFLRAWLLLWPGLGLA